jgi:hypothetical protein
MVAMDWIRCVTVIMVAARGDHGRDAAEELGATAAGALDVMRQRARAALRRVAEGCFPFLPLFFLPLFSSLFENRE